MCLCVHTYMHHYNAIYSHLWTMVWLFRIAFSQPEISTDNVTYRYYVYKMIYVWICTCIVQTFFGVCTCTLCIWCTTVTSPNLYKIPCMPTVSQLQAQHKPNYSLHQTIHIHIMPPTMEYWSSVGSLDMCMHTYRDCTWVFGELIINYAIVCTHDHFLTPPVAPWAQCPLSLFVCYILIACTRCGSSVIIIVTSSQDK